MGIDTSIYQNLGRGVKSVADYDSEYAAARQNKLAEMMGSMKMDEAQRGIADQNALRGVYAQFGTDSAANTNALYKAGLGKEAGAYAKSAQDIAKDKAATEKDQLANVMQKINMAGQLYGSVTDQPSHDRALATAKANGMDVSNVPLQYDPAFIKSKIDEGTDMKTRLEQLWKQKAYDMPDANAVLSANTSTSNNAATNATSRQNNAATIGQAERSSLRTDARSRDTNAATLTKPFEVTGPDGTPVLVRQDKQGNISRVEGFGPKAGSVKLTEDQGKATGWLVQAENAFGNMQGAMRRNPSSAKPGFNDALGSIPGLGGMANIMRGADRQRFMQGASSLSEALLRAATGAGVNKDEAIQKVQELTPVFGEDEANTKQKMDAIPLYIESLKVRSGPGAKQVPGILERGAAASGKSANNIDSLLDKYK